MYVLLCKGAMFFRDLVYVHFGDLAIPRSLHLFFYIIYDCPYIDNQCSVSCAHSAEIDLEMAAFDISYIIRACSIVPQTRQNLLSKE